VRPSARRVARNLTTHSNKLALPQPFIINADGSPVNPVAVHLFLLREEK
jgi:hypothetical protein